MVSSDHRLPIADTAGLPGPASWPLQPVKRVRALEYTRRPINVLMLCDQFVLPYRVLRCFDAAGAAVHVLGGPGSQGLRFSRYCRSYRPSRYGFATLCDAISQEVNACITECAIDLVIAGSHQSTRTLIALKPALSAPCFPMPTLDQFDLLNNKWSFTQLCRQLGIRCPRSELVANRTELLRQLSSGETALPCIAKPLDLHGARGVIPIKSQKDVDVTRTIEYGPILVQEYVEGEDISTAVYCDHGKILAFTAFKRKRATYWTIQSREIQDEVAKLADVTQITGVLCFCIKIGRDGTNYWLECNPRFFYSMPLSMLAGINFAAFGLPHAPPNLRPSVPTGTNVRTLKAIAADLWRPWCLTSRDGAFVWSLVADPVPSVRELLGIDL